MVTLVTGATGFVGSAVVRQLLARGAPVRVIKRAGSGLANLKGLRVEVVTADLRDRGSLKSALKDVTALYHVAADYRLWVRDPEEIYATNVDGTRDLMVAAGEAGVGRIVYTSSVATLGIDPSGKPADEDTPATLDDMIGHYKRSKFLAERAVLDLAAEGLPVVIVNPSTPVGPRDVKPTPTGRMILEAALGRMPAYIQTGLNFVHVDDVARGHLQAFDAGRVGERYILGGEDLALSEMLAEVAALTGRKAPRLCLPRRAIYPIAAMAEGFARLSRGSEPFVTIDGLRLAKKFMYFTSGKAQRELGYSFRPAREAFRDAIVAFGIPLALQPVHRLRARAALPLSAPERAHH